MSSGMYDHNAIESKWRAYWLENKTFRSEVDAAKPKYYILDMFPYPSGDGLHVGHPLGYVATDIIARVKRMQGFNVLHPMGWDAFGLPAERHAMRTGEHPAIITKRNCDNFRRQLQLLGLSYDWDREIDTTDPGYYKWTQWIFQVLFERGLAYQIEAPVNWCPAIGTVLANEEVKDGKYVETGDPVEKRMMRQWMLKITAYAERLLADLDTLEWPESVKSMQREWIGKSEGADAVFRVTGTDLTFTVFTTRPDTLFGATYCVLAPEHPLTLQITLDTQRAEVEAYVQAASKRSAQDRMQAEREKTGVFTGAYAVNPVNGKEIPIWTADYVLAEYGYGAIMAVPAHDTRDYEFATKFGLPIVEVVSGGDISQEAYTGDGVLVNSEIINGLSVPDAKQKICAWLEERGLGKGTVNYRLRDWLFSRQRYWGEPIPLVTLEDGTVRAVPMEDLPVMLPELDEYKPTEDGQPPLARATDWVHATDPETGKPALRETNTMPQWAGSCWYYLRFVDARNEQAAWSKEAEQYWMPVDLYVGGTEHAVLHLLYARFWHKVLYDAGYVSTIEPFSRLFNPGKILSYSFRSKQGEYFKPSEVAWSNLGTIDDENSYVGIGDVVHHMSREHSYLRDNDIVEVWYDAVKDRLIGTGHEDYVFKIDSTDLVAFDHLAVEVAEWERVKPVNVPNQVTLKEKAVFRLKKGRRERVSPFLRLDTQVEKMSKSRLNVVNPDDIVTELGADSMRLYQMFMGPLDRDKPWTEEGLHGIHRFLRRVWSLVVAEDGSLNAKVVASGGDESMLKTLHQTIKSVTEDVQNLQFNTAISRMMEYLNAAVKAKTINKSEIEQYLLLLSPFAPHMCEELWERLGHTGTIAYESWPSYDASLLVEDIIEIPVQVNGKLRGVIAVAADADKDTVLAASKAEPKVQSHIDGKNLVKEIYVPGKMVNLIAK